MLLRALIALTAAVAAFTPLQLARSTSLKAGKGFGPDATDRPPLQVPVSSNPDPTGPAGKVARVQTAVSERFTLVYTCNICETRNAISVSRVAWKEGLVIGKCMGCSARHMLADNAGLTDQTNSSRFSNVVNEAIARGENVRRESLNDAEALADCGVELLPDGNVSLVARAGEETVKTSQKNGQQVIATRRVEDGTPIIVIQQESAPQVSVVDDTKPPPQLLPAAAPVVELQAGTDAGDVLRVTTDFGVVHVLVPAGAGAGARLELGGVVEVKVPSDASTGDVVGVALPDGSVVSVEVLAEDLGAALAVAFPVVVV